MLIELHYLPNIDYFLQFLKADEVIIETKEHFQKQSYRNRTLIMGANKVETLTIPIAHHSKDQNIESIKIDYNSRWSSIHLQAIRSAYGRSPFFEYYFPLIEPMYLKKNLFLFDFNYELLSVCLEILKIKTLVKKSELYQPQNINNKNDFRNLIHPKKRICNMDILTTLSYNQTFGKEFVNNLSIIDLIFNEGGYSKQILQNCID